MSRRRLTPILLAVGLLVTAVAGPGAAAAAASSLTPTPPVTLSTAIGSATQTVAVPVTTTSSAPARLPHTGANVGLELLVAAAMLGAGVLLRRRDPARREPRS
jgi:LPXTG-motif cell wall-anchored protein